MDKMEIIQMFRDLAKEDPLKAQIVGKNLLCNNPQDEAIFEEYVMFCLSNAKLTDDESICRFLLTEAEHAIQDYCQLCKINPAIFEKITSISGEYSSTVEFISEKNLNQIRENNKTLLSELEGLYKRLKDRYNWDETIKELKELDSKFDKDQFEKEEMDLYNSYSTKIADLISAQMKEKQKEDAMTALKDFQKCYEDFCNDKKMRKEEDKLLPLISNCLFKYDINSLPPDVVLYYNYVRDYIFNNIKDDLKFKFVKCSIDNIK